MSRHIIYTDHEHEVSVGYENPPNSFYIRIAPKDGSLNETYYEQFDPNNAGIAEMWGEVTEVGAVDVRTRDSVTKCLENERDQLTNRDVHVNWVGRIPMSL